jgi:hypothetical protein
MADDPQPSDGPTEQEIAAIHAAMALLDAGTRLPAPKTWDELRIGVMAWLELRWTDKEGSPRYCPTCSDDGWLLGQIISVPSDRRWPLPPGQGHGSYPFLQLGCQSCGDVRLLDALLIFEAQASWKPSSSEAETT